MRTIAANIRLLASVVAAVISAIGRRLRRGPAVPGWSWSVELRAVALRAFIMGSGVHSDREARSKLEARFNPPLPRRLRSVMGVRQETIGGVPGEWHERTDTTLTNRCTVLYFHGGGYLSGSAGTHRRWGGDLG